jgi:hypothetical protein
MATLRTVSAPHAAPCISVVRAPPRPIRRPHRESLCNAMFHQEKAASFPAWHTAC